MTVVISDDRTCWVADDWLVFTSVEARIGPLSNLTFVSATGNLISRGRELSEVGQLRSR